WQDQIHGAHSGHPVYNARGIGICLIGNFEQQPPTQKQLNSLKLLVKVLAKRHQIPGHRILGHASIKATACPGTYFPLKEVRSFTDQP
ncbi:MAG: N-acetylmuramoyl-L-alanine amidase, partial [Planctomycetaceae bacterium]|nr:N-acetylmuramoyl-L-alanine amidase [Planctomycetaceae bacterium]